MTFSFRPRRLSEVPRTAASVNTVVSWNDAAEMNDSVASEALVIPSSTGSKRAGSSLRPRGAFSDNALALHLFAVQELAAALVGDLDLAQHLAGDHLDVLVVDLHALQAIHVLDFLHQVGSQRFDTQQAQDVLRLGSPSTMVSPLVTCSPSNTMTWRYFGISSSCSNHRCP